MDSVPTAAPPFEVAGQGFVLLYRLPAEALTGSGVVPPELARRFVGGTSAVVFGDYARSGVGPHRELLFVPGRFRAGGASYYGVTCSLASTEAAVAAGRRNWGLPRSLAELEVERSGREERLTVRRQGRPVASFTLRAGRLGLPMTTEVVPAARRSIVQHDGSRILLTTPSGRATLRRARLVEVRVEDGSLPELDRYQPVAAIKIEGLAVRLPAARVAELRPEPPAARPRG